jgi:hypothetical protein
MAASKLHRDQRGAILLIGLFAALSLCGALWSLIGIGNAITLHDRGQEAADAAALSSAATQARAMNATAAINFIMLAMVGAYLSFAVIADLALVIAAYIIGVSFAEKVGGDFGDAAYQTFRTLIRFEQGMGASFAAMHQAQLGLALGAPQLGTLASVEVNAGRQYEGMTLGWSNFRSDVVARTGEHQPYASKPSAPNPPLKTPESCKKPGTITCTMADQFFPVLEAPPPWNAGKNDTVTLGLPFAAEPASALCVRAGSLLFKDFGEAVDPLRFGKGADDAMKVMNAREKKLPIPVHCSDEVNRNTVAAMTGTPRPRDVWTAKGPKRMTAGNGEMAMRVLGWATTREESTLDDATQRVKLAAYDLTGATDRSVLVYDAQAEFYYACSTRWDAPACNGGEIATSGIGYEQTLYRMNWRARLTRSRTPQRVFGAAVDSIVNLGGAVVSRAGVSIGEWKRVADHFREQRSPKLPSLH